jgi:Zn-finger nucleic acid-binding protein
MDCPIDGTTLAMSDKQGIEIDYCPQCRGVWLDRGELDKIIERSADWSGDRDDDRDRDRGRDDDRDRDRDDDRSRFGRKDEKAEKPKKSKSKSFFETIMESVGEG